MSQGWSFNRGRGQGLFKITLTSPIEDVAPYKAIFTRHQVEGIETPITVQPAPSSGYRGQKTGTLVTFVAASFGPLATVQTTVQQCNIWQSNGCIWDSQKYRVTDTVNGNRYCVVDTKDKVIPGSIMVLSPATQQKVTVQPAKWTMWAPVLFYKHSMLPRTSEARSK